tara:strand:- start:734 stop:2035 length:1302 start_codon:yes stop_codon:yes gene_type:complete
MSYLGKVRPTIALTSSDIEDNAVITSKIIDDAVTSAKIDDATIVNADVNASAGIVQSKLATLVIDTAELAADAVTPAKMANSAYLANRNTIINGAMEISQRSTSVAAITNDGFYTVDRWKIFNDTLGTFTMSQSTTAPTDQGFSSSLKMDCTTADATPAAADRLGIRYYYEGYDIQNLKYATSNAESTTISFWVRSSKTGTYIVELYGVTAGRQISKAYTISVADTWEKKTITFAGDTAGTYNNDNTGELLVSFWLGTGSNYSSGTLNQSWAAVNHVNRAVGQVNIADSTSGDWYITGIQLEVGDSATPFEHKTFGQELEDCKRYWQKSYAYGTALGTATQSGNSMIYMTNLNTSTYTLYYENHFDKAMRAAPTVTAYDSSAGTSGSVDMSGVPTTAGIDQQTERTCRVYNGATTPSSPIRSINFQWQADAEL